MRSVLVELAISELQALAWALAGMMLAGWLAEHYWRAALVFAVCVMIAIYNAVGGVLDALADPPTP